MRSKSSLGNSQFVSNFSQNNINEVVSKDNFQSENKLDK